MPMRSKNWSFAECCSEVARLSMVWGEGVEGKDAGGGGTGTRWICKNEKVAMKILTMTLMQ